MEIYDILKSAHSGWRWIVLILLVAAVVKMHTGWKGKKVFTAGSKKMALFAMIAYHIQFLLGWVMYIINGANKVSFEAGFMANKVLRFFTMEHSIMMTLAFILITMGYSKSKKATDDIKKFKVVAIFYTIALILILAGIPWPFRGLGAGWF